MGEKRGLRGLQAWCRIVTEGHKNVHVCDMSASWRDGLAFCALIHHFRPDLIDFDSLSQDDIMYNNRLAFTVAEQHLGIPALLDPEDMVKYEEPDKLSIATYVSQFYQYFEGRGRAEEKMRTPVKRVFVDRAFTPTALPAKVPLQGFKRDEKCFKCRNRVFILERLMVDGKLYHRMCFQCCRCTTILRPGAYAKSDEDGTYECVVCPVDEEKQQSAFTPETELKEINNEVQIDETKLSASKPLVTEVNLNGNNSVKEAQKVFLERELSNSGSFKEAVDSLNAERIVSNDLSSPVISNDEQKEMKVEVDGVPQRHEEAEVSVLHSNSGQQFVNPVSKSLGGHQSTSVDAKPLPTLRKEVTVEEERSKHEKPTAYSSVIYKPKSLNTSFGVSEPLKKEEILKEKSKTRVVPQENVVPSTGDASSIEKENNSSDLKAEKQPTPPTRTKRKQHGSFVDLPEVEDRTRVARNFAPLTFRRVSSSIELSREKESPNAAVALPTITSPTYNRPVISPDSSLPGKVKIPPAFQRTSLPVTSFSQESSISPLSKITLLQSRYSAYGRSVSNRSLVSDSLFGDKDLSPTRERASLDKEGAKSLEMLDDKSTSRSTETDNLVPVRRHSSDNQTSPQTTHSGDKPEERDFVKTSKDLPVEVEEPTEKSMPKRETDNLVLVRRHSSDNQTLPETANSQDKLNTREFVKTIQEIPIANNSMPKTGTDGSALNKIKPKEVKTPEKPKKPLVTVEVIRKVVKPANTLPLYPGELNPFGEEEEYPDDLNPFGESDEETEEYEKIEQPRSFTSSSRNSSSLQLSLHGSDYDDSLNPFCDSEDDLSLETQSPRSSRNAIKVQTPKKKSRAPPPPPSVVSLLSSKPSSPSVSPASSLRPSPRMQKRLAPKPPAEESLPNAKNPEDEKATKEMNNLSIAKNNENTVEGSAEAKNTNTFGYWKRKKRPAPSVPVPKRQIHRIPIKDIQEELEEIWEKQSELESQGRQLEMMIRDQPDAGGDAKEDDEELIVKLFDLVNQKNNLFRRQAELMYIKRSQTLEVEQAELEYQIRCLMSKPERLRSEVDVAREEELLQRLVEVVEHRNEIVESMDMDRQRVQDEDLSIKEQFGRQSSSGDLSQNSTLEPMPEEKAKKKKSKFKDKFKKDSNKKSSEDEKGSKWKLNKKS